MENRFPNGSAVHCSILSPSPSPIKAWKREMEDDNSDNKSRNYDYPRDPSLTPSPPPEAVTAKGRLEFHHHGLTTSPIVATATAGKQKGTVESQIKAEIEALPEEERLQAETDVRGENPVGEPLRLAQIELDSFDRELTKLVQSNPQYHDLRSELDNDFVKDTQLRWKMLRAEYYDCRRAALRMAKFLELLQEVFGSYLLMRPIQLVDLSPEERQIQRRGLQQLFKFRDHAGRRIVGCFDAYNSPTTSIRTLLRLGLYLLQVASDDEETQKQGVVFIFMLLKDIHPPSTMSSNNPFASSRWHTLAKALNRIFQCAPVRVGAIHVCSQGVNDLETSKAELANQFGLKERARCRFHNGTSMEISMALDGYGIPTDRLPLKYDGTIKIEDHLQWIAVREAKEEAFRQGRDLDVVECPMNLDILSGRGQLVRNHPGNVSFRRDFIQARSTQYNAAHTRDEKNEIASVILNDIAAMNRRFLKQHPSGYWSELERKVAKEKVMMAFREYRKSQKLEESRSSSSSTTSYQFPPHIQQQSSSTSSSHQLQQHQPLPHHLHHHLHHHPHQQQQPYHHPFHPHYHAGHRRAASDDSPPGGNEHHSKRFKSG